MTDLRLDVLDRAKRYLNTFPPTSLDPFEEWELVYGMVGFARELVELKTPLDRIEARFKQDLGPALLDKGLAPTDIIDIIKTASNGQMYGRVKLVDEARRLASQRKAPEPEPSPTSSPAPELAPRTVVPYPNRLHAEAFYGVLGDLVRVIEPATEADPAALLLTNLVLFGNVIGRGPHFIAEGSEHHGNLFVAVVGTTSKGRKGSSLSRARAGFAQIDEAWAKDRVTGGLSTGEGLIWFVRDPIIKTEAVRQNGRRTGEHEQVTADEGISDKRALFVEEELAAASGIMSRQGNSLSGTLRQAWDRGNLAFATKNSPAKATGAHISILGHSTRDELVRNLTATECANGFANRFLFCCAARSKVLPFGGKVDEDVLRRVVHRLADATAFARDLGRDHHEVGWGDAAELWASRYPALSEGKPGLFGAVTSRAEAQVVRLALLFALADQVPVIKTPHLQAALAIWDYCHDSAHFIFGRSLGDPVADQLLGHLRTAGPTGLSITEAYDRFGRHVTKVDLDRAFGLLEEQGLVSRQIVQTGGRPGTRYFAGQAAKEAK